MSLFDSISSKVSGIATNGISRGSVARIANAAINKVNPKISSKIPGGLGAAVGSLINGQGVGSVVERIGRSALGQLQGKIAGKIGFPLASELFGLFGLGVGSAVSVGSGTPVITGGVTLQEIKEIFERSQNIDYARKNLFYISIVELSQGSGWVGKNEADLNMFATDVSYSPVTIQGDPVSVGGAVFDALKGTERIEVRVTTMDDSTGTLKQWFDQKAQEVSKPDGTFGLPVNYLLKLTIIHSSINDKNGGMKREILVRPTSIEHELSRTEDGLEQLQMVFTQHDTFSLNA